MAQSFLQKHSFIETEKKAFEAIQRIFPCEEDLLDKIPLDKIVASFQKDLLLSKKPFLIRITGQSGSGKSSQIVPSLQFALKQKQYIKINVGLFAPFHPKYELWQKEQPDKMRENTNGFALKALVLFYKYCILNRVNVVLDMTLLEPEIDIYLMMLAKEMGYSIQTHLLCVPKKISDSFIRLRQKETGRYVRPTSSVYFFNALPRSLKALTHSKLFSKKDTLILWNHYLSHPIKQTHLNNPFAARLLQEYRGKNFRTKKAQKLLNVKKKLMKNFEEMLDV